MGLAVPSTATYDAGMPDAPRRAAPSRQLNIRLPADIWNQLDAAAFVLGLPQSRIVMDSLKVYLDGLPAAKRRAIEDAIALRKKHT